MDGKHSMRLQNVNVHVWTGPDFRILPQLLDMRNRGLPID